MTSDPAPDDTTASPFDELQRHAELIEAAGEQRGRITATATDEDATVSVAANADGDLVSIELSAAALSLDVTHLGRCITDTANEARRRAHALAERHMDDLFRAQEDIVARIHATQELWPTVDDNQAVADGGGSSWPDVDLAEEAINSEVGPDGIMPPLAPHRRPLRRPLVITNGIVTSVDDHSYSTGPDAEFLASLAGGLVAYGATDVPIYPYTCELHSAGQIPTGREVLRSLGVARFCSTQTADLDATSMPYPGYTPSVSSGPEPDNDQIHTDPEGQHLFLTDEDNGGIPDDRHQRLKSHVIDGHLTYVLIHEPREQHDDFWFSEWVMLFAVGVSPVTGNLIGVVGHQVCHNLCD